MNLIARLKDMWRRHDERLAEDALEERSSGEDLELTAGLDRQIEAAAGRRQQRTEHDEPK